MSAAQQLRTQLLRELKAFEPFRHVPEQWRWEEVRLHELATGPLPPSDADLTFVAQALLLPLTKLDCGTRSPDFMLELDWTNETHCKHVLDLLMHE